MATIRRHNNTKKDKIEIVYREKTLYPKDILLLKIKSEIDLNEINLSGVDLSETELSNVILANLDLSYSNFSSVYFFKANLSNSDFFRARLNKANFSQANLSGANLAFANLSGCNFTNTDLSNTNLLGANLSYANLEGANLFNSNLTRADLSYANLQNADISRAQLNKANLNKVKNLELIQKQINKNNKHLYIAIPNKVSLADAENITNAAIKLMIAIGYELKQVNGPIIGSFFKELWFLIKKSITPKKIEKNLEKAKDALEATYFDKPMAEAQGAISSSTAELIKSIEHVDEVVIRLDRLILVKALIEGKSVLLTTTITVEFGRLLNHNPKILNHPKEVYYFLTNNSDKSNISSKSLTNLDIE